MTDTAPTGLDAAKLARLEHMLARQDILDCMVRFARGMDRFDRALFLSAFHADAVCDAGPFVGPPATLYDWAHDLHEAGQSSTLHNLLNHSCEIDGETAHAETYYLFTGANRDGTNWIAGGRYVDRLERRAGAWKIAQRSNAQEWSGVIASTAAPFADIADLHLNGAPSRSGEDLSYRRPLTNRRAMQRP